MFIIDLSRHLIITITIMTTKTNWFAFLRSLEDITRNGKSQLTGAEAFNEFINLLFLKFKETDILNKINNTEEETDMWLRTAEVDEDFLIGTLYTKYCTTYNLNKGKKIDNTETEAKISKEANDLYCILYNFSRQWDEMPEIVDDEPTGTFIKKLNGKKKCIMGRFLHNEEFYNIAEGERRQDNITQFTRNHKFDIMNLIIRIHETFGNKQFTDMDFDAFGEGYEKYTADEVMSAKSWGQYFTRRDVIDLIVHEIKPQHNEKGSDETCGTCGFLLSFNKYVKQDLTKLVDLKKIKKDQFTERHQQFKNNIYGYELKWPVYKPLMLNLLCQKINLSNIRLGSCLGKDNFDHPDQYDFMAGNPPYGGSIQWEPWMNGCFDIRVRNSVALIIQLYLYKLKDGGRCGLVVDRGILNNGTEKKNSWEKNLRTKLLTENNLYKIILLPTGIFAHTNFATAIIFFNKGGRSKQVEFVEGYFKDTDKGKGNKTMYFNPGIVVDAKKLKEKNYSLKLDDYVDRVVEDTNGYVKLGDVININFGTRITKSKDGINENTESSIYPVYGGGGITFYTDKKNRSGETIVISRFGVSPKCVRIIKGDIFLNDSGMSIDIKHEEKYNIKFVKYILFFNQQQIYDKYAQGTGQKNMMTGKLLEEFYIPQLSTIHQEEIVTLLDRIYTTYKIEDTVKYLQKAKLFNLLIHKQYDEFENLLWYQEKLPRMYDDLKQVDRIKKDHIRGLFNTVETKKHLLGDIVDIKRGKSLPKNKMVSGIYPVITGCNEIKHYHNETNLDGSQYVFVSRVGSAGSIMMYNDHCYLTDLSFALKPNDNICLRAYLYMFLTYNQRILKNITETNGPPNINGVRLQSVHIQIPSIPDQQKIIDMILTIESNRSTYATYAQMLQQQIDMMETTIGNLCMVGQEVDRTNVGEQLNDDVPAEEIDSADCRDDIPTERPIVRKKIKPIVGKKKKVADDLDCSDDGLLEENNSMDCSDIHVEAHIVGRNIKANKQIVKKNPSIDKSDDVQIVGKKLKANNPIIKKKKPSTDAMDTTDKKKKTVYRTTTNDS